LLSFGFGFELVIAFSLASSLAYFQETRQGQSEEAIALQKQILKFAEVELLPDCEKEGGEVLAGLLLMTAKLHAKFGNLSSVIATNERLLTLIATSEAISNAVTVNSLARETEAERGGGDTSQALPPVNNAVIPPEKLCEFYAFVAKFNHVSLKDAKAALPYQLKVLIQLFRFLYSIVFSLIFCFFNALQSHFLGNEPMLGFFRLFG
jgi:hypothetical protein